MSAPASASSDAARGTPAGGIAAWHGHLVATGEWQDDPAQRRAVELLQEFSDQIAADDNRGWLQKLSGNGGDSRAGVYLHGGVGRGKSFLMDGFFINAPVDKKIRVHYHAFMRRFHEDMKARAGREDALLEVADGITQKAALICFDEFHINDITNAMVMARLLARLLENGARFVMTSNYAPQDLYPNGLGRDRFLPAIALLEERFSVFHLTGGEDYRLRQLRRGQMWHLAGRDDAQMAEAFEHLSGGILLTQSVRVNNRRIPARARTTDAVWFDFDELCGNAHGKNDYLEIAARHASLFLSGVPVFAGEAAKSEAARRFVWLVDICYDRRVKLIISAAAAVKDLYPDSAGGESGRTLSRLMEMQSQDYLGFCVLE